MKTIIFKLISIVATVINVSALCGVIYILANSELLSLSHFNEMATPSSGWYFIHPETKLFAFNIFMPLQLTFITSLLSGVLTFVYIKWKKSSLSMEDIDTFESRTAILTSVNIVSLISLVLCIIPSILFYRFIPISILYIVLWGILLKVIPISNIIRKI